jgi:hypothetical protein
MLCYENSLGIVSVIKEKLFESLSYTFKFSDQLISE